jgi:hypothetical protein
MVSAASGGKIGHGPEGLGRLIHEEESDTQSFNLHALAGAVP